MKKQLMKIFILIVLLYSSLLGQLQMKMSTDKDVYEYGETINIICSITNVTDTTFKVLSPSYESCDAQFRFNDYYSGEWTACLATFKEIYYQPYTTKKFKWTIDPQVFGLPNKNGEQQIIGDYSYGVGDVLNHTYYELKDTIYIQAPEYLGCQISVSFFIENDSLVTILKDSLNAVVLDRYDYGDIYTELWQVSGSNADSLSKFLNNDVRIRDAYINRNIFYDSVYVTSPKDFYPLSVGNKWVYQTVGYNWNGDGPADHFYYESIKEVVGDTLLENGESYFVINGGLGTYFERYNEDLTKVWIYADNDQANENHEILSYDLNTEVGDTVHAAFSDYENFSDYTYQYHYEDSTSLVIFGITSKKKLFQELYSLGGQYYQLAENFGIVRSEAGWDFGEAFTYLKGCIIDGVVYGDTSLIVAVEDEEKLSNKFSLSQNYPNPFNPNTKIMFTIPAVETTHRVVSTKLIVYDILGGEVKTLLNKPMQSGSYEVEFDGSNLPSGVYFYRITAGKFTQTRKMMLLK